MFLRILGESFVRNPRRKLLAGAALMLGIAVTTAMLTVALDVGDRLAAEFRALGANLVVTPQADTLPLEIGGVDYRPVDAGAYLDTAELGKLLYTEYVYAFELAAVLLLIAIVAAISLTMRKRPGLKQQDVAKQVAVRREDRVRIIKMPAEGTSKPESPVATGPASSEKAP